MYAAAENRAEKNRAVPVMEKGIVLFLHCFHKA